MDSPPPPAVTYDETIADVSVSGGLTVPATSGHVNAARHGGNDASGGGNSDGTLPVDQQQQQQQQQQQEEGEEGILTSLEELLELIDNHHELMERNFKGDPLIHHVLSQTRTDTRMLCRVVFCAGKDEDKNDDGNERLGVTDDSGEDCARMDAFNAFLTHPVIKANKTVFDVVVTQQVIENNIGNQVSATISDDGVGNSTNNISDNLDGIVASTEDSSFSCLTFQKVLLNGWHITIDEETFNTLAFAPDYADQQGINDIHHLSVRGMGLFTDKTSSLVPRGSRRRNGGRVPVALVFACADADRIARHEAKAKRDTEADDRARTFGAVFGGVRADNKKTAMEKMREALSKGSTLIELNVRLSSDRARFDSNTQGFEQIRTSSNVVQVLLPFVNSSNKVDSALLWCLVRKVCDKNVKRLRAAYASYAKRARFQDKLEYWSALRRDNNAVGAAGATQQLLLRVFDTCLCGADGVMFEGAAALAERYKREYKTRTLEYVLQRLIQWQASSSMSTGFVSGLGGFVTMAVTVPAGLMATWVTSARLAFAIAAIYGYDIWSPPVCAAVLHSLVGSGSKSSKKDDNKADEEQTPEEMLKARLREGYAALTTDLPQHDGISATGTGTEASNSTNENIAICAQPQKQNNTRTLLSESRRKGTDEGPEDLFTTLYELFGLLPTASATEVRRAYKQMALRCHPDKVQGSPAEVKRANIDFQILVAAYEILGDPVKRKAYDDELKRGTWKWSDFSWNVVGGVGRAREAFARFAKMDLHDPSLYLATRVTAQVTVSVAEEVTSKAAIRSLAAVELRSSLAAGKQLAASATARSGPKLIPFIGAVFNATVDCLTTASVGRTANRVFALDTTSAT